MQPYSSDTIAARATPAGHGGVAIIRISGPMVKDIIPLIFKCKLLPKQIHFVSFYDEQEVILDQGIGLYFPNPNSFTGEDVLEFQGHGGPVIVDMLLQRLLGLGIRLARPGEFSERAFLNDKIDLAQAEAIADLIHASSQQAARSAMRSLQGEFSKLVNGLNTEIIQARMYVEAAIDFADEEIDFLQDEALIEKLHGLQQKVIHILQQAKQGHLLQEGISIVITGEPNVGKSSLLNALSGKEVAIVTDIEGTTRDILRNAINIDGMPLHLIDTAGLRQSEDIIEQEGIRRAKQEIEIADLILYVIDAKQTIAKPLEKSNVIYIRNKIDLVDEVAQVIQQDGKPVVSLSAKTNDGLTLLKNEIKRFVGFSANEESVFLARRRHLDALIKSQVHLTDSLSNLREHQAGELVAEDLRQAHLALNEITGEFTTDDLLGQIFSTFCIGK